VKFADANHDVQNTNSMTIFHFSNFHRSVCGKGYKMVVVLV